MSAASDFTRLKATFRQRGWYQRPTRRVLAELAWHVLVFCAGLAVIIASDSYLLKAVGLLLVTLGLLGVGTNTHTSAHYATSRKRWLNELLTYFGYPFFLQVSATYWWHKHNVRHHPHVNVVEEDPDIDIRPWFALTEVAIQESRGLRRWYYRHQWLVFPFALAFNSFGIQFGSWRHLLTMLRNKEERNATHTFDLVAMTAHWAVWIVIPACFFPLSSVILFHVARAVTMGYALFAVLAPCHYPAEAQVLTRKERDGLDFFARQTVTAVNFETGPLGRLLCSGLEYHIEHHLLPAMCHVYYPAASVLVREFCEAHNYPYRSFTWGEALRKTFANVRNPKRAEEAPPAEGEPLAVVHMPVAAQR